MHHYSKLVKEAFALEKIIQLPVNTHRFVSIEWTVLIPSVVSMTWHLLWHWTDTRKVNGCRNKHPPPSSCVTMATRGSGSNKIDTSTRTPTPSPTHKHKSWGSAFILLLRDEPILRFCTFTRSRHYEVKTCDTFKCNRDEEVKTRDLHPTWSTDTWRWLWNPHCHNTEHVSLFKYRETRYKENSFYSKSKVDFVN